MMKPVVALLVLVLLAGLFVASVSLRTPRLAADPLQLREPLPDNGNVGGDHLYTHAEVEALVAEMEADLPATRPAEARGHADARAP